MADIHQFKKKSGFEYGKKLKIFDIIVLKIKLGKPLH